MAIARGLPLRLALFAALLVLLHANAAWILRTDAAARAPQLIAAAVLVDLTFTTALAFYAFFIRSGRMSWSAVLPVLVVNGVVGRAALPSHAPGWTAASLMIAGAAAELTILALVARNVGPVVHRYRSERARGEPLSAALEEAFALRLPRPVAALAAGEAMLLVMLARVFARSVPRHDGHGRFSVHRDSGAVALSGVLVFALVIETAVVSLLLADWPVLGVVHAVLSGYGALWLLGDLTALRTTATTLFADRLDARVGLRWRVVIPRDAIVRAERVSEAPAGALDLALPGATVLLLTLDREVEVAGPLGIRRRGRAVCLSVDEPGALLQRIT